MRLLKPGILLRYPLYINFLLFFLFTTIFCGLKFWLIAKYGNNTPFWDQWDAEALKLYQPYLSHSLTTGDLLSTHNEHRIFTTRLLSLLLLNINSGWNPLLQMVVNTGIYALTIGMAILMLAKIVGKNHLPVLIMFSLFLFTTPYGWENTLSGFQSQFYFVIFFSIASLWAILKKEPLSIAWWGGTGLAVLAFLSLASGSFAIGAAVFTGIVMFFTNIRRTPKQLTAICILALLFIISIKLTPQVPGHQMLKATSFGQFYTALTGILSWPIPGGIVVAIFRNLPIVFFVLITLKSPPESKSPRWFLFTLVIWALGQAFSLAYGRATLFSSSRYTDLYCITLLIDLACMLCIPAIAFKKWRTEIAIFAALWIIVMLVSFFRVAWQKLPDELATKRETSLLQEINTRSYLVTGDTNFIRNKPELQVPYPDPARFAMILSSPELRSILPSNIKPGLLPALTQDSTNSFIPNGYYITTPPSPGGCWGSYTGIGDEAIGRLTLNFDMPVGGKVTIPVAGYPLKEGIRIEVIQNGQSIPLPLAENPKETWGLAVIKLDKGPFSIQASDQSKSTWLAVGNPIVGGRFDNFINKLLSHYYLFIFLGLAAFAVLVLINGFKIKQANENAE